MQVLGVEFCLYSGLCKDGGGKKRQGPILVRFDKNTIKSERFFDWLVVNLFLKEECYV